MNTVEDRLRAALTAKSDAVTLDKADPGALPPPPAPAEIIRLVPDVSARPQRRIAPVLAAVAAAVVLALVAGTLLAGRGRGPATDPAGSRTQVPWSRVGADWTLMVTLQDSAHGSGVLYLADPAGHRYRISSLPPWFLHLEQWSFDTGQALITADSDPATNAGKILLVDLRTGSQTKLSVPARYNTVQFAGRDHKLLLATSPLWMVAVDRTGRRTATFQGPEFWGSVVSPDGSQVVAGTVKGLAVYDVATGRRIRTLAAPAGYRNCIAVFGTAMAAADVTGRCESSTRQNVIANFSFSPAGSHRPTAQPVPSGWTAVSFSDGLVAVRHASPVIYQLRDVRFARVTGGRLVPLTLPSQLEQTGWQIASSGSHSFLVGLLPDPNDSNPAELARWNPFTGAFVVLFRSDRDRARLVSAVGWQASA